MTPSLKRFPFKAMGCPCEIQIIHESRITAKKVAQALIADVNRLEVKYSRYRDDSFLSQINQSAGKTEGIELDAETRSLFEHADACYRHSDGLFDITSGVLRKIWNFREGRVPSQQEIDDVLPLIGFEKLNWHDGHLEIPQQMEIDFGGIVKEYAADSAARLGRNLGISHGLVNLGGDFAVIGRKPDAKPWPVGISDPNNPTSMMARIDVLDGGLASSGDYERCFVYEGRRYSHILNPKTGWPTQGLRAVSVAGNLCTVAGSIATIAMLKPEAEGIIWLQESTLPFIYMDSTQEIKGPAIQAPIFD